MKGGICSEEKMQRAIHCEEPSNLNRLAAMLSWQTESQKSEDLKSEELKRTHSGGASITQSEPTNVNRLATMLSWQTESEKSEELKSEERRWDIRRMVSGGVSVARSEAPIQVKEKSHSTYSNFMGFNCLRPAMTDSVADVPANEYLSTTTPEKQQLLLADEANLLPQLPSAPTGENRVGTLPELLVKTTDDGDVNDISIRPQDNGQLEDAYVQQLKNIFTYWRKDTNKQIQDVQGGLLALLAENSRRRDKDDVLTHRKDDGKLSFSTKVQNLETSFTHWRQDISKQLQKIQDSQELHLKTIIEAREQEQMQCNSIIEERLRSQIHQQNEAMTAMELKLRRLEAKLERNVGETHRSNVKHNAPSFEGHMDENEPQAYNDFPRSKRPSFRSQGKHKSRYVRARESLESMGATKNYGRHSNDRTHSYDHSNIITGVTSAGTSLSSDVAFGYNVEDAMKESFSESLCSDRAVRESYQNTNRSTMGGKANWSVHPVEGKHGRTFGSSKLSIEATLETDRSTDSGPDTFNNRTELTVDCSNDTFTTCRDQSVTGNVQFRKIEPFSSSIAVAPKQRSETRRITSSNYTKNVRGSKSMALTSRAVSIRTDISKLLDNNILQQRSSETNETITMPEGLDNPSDEYDILSESAYDSFATSTNWREEYEARLEALSKRRE